MNIIHTAEVDRGYFSIRELHGIYYLHMKAPLQKEQCIVLNEDQYQALSKDVGRQNLGKSYEVEVNGEPVTLLEDSPGQVSYATLCKASGNDPKRTVTIMYLLPDGRKGAPSKGKDSPIMNGAKYDLAITNNA